MAALSSCNSAAATGMGASRHLCWRMLSVRPRRFLHLMLALTLAVGLAAQGVSAGNTGAMADDRAHPMAAHMSMAAADGMPMCDTCDACKNDSCKGGLCPLSGNCSTHCGSLTALPVFGTAIAALLGERAANSPVSFRSGWDPPPDPYPPRATILS